MKQNKDLLKYKITPAGSLGLLALGHVGLMAWRDVKSRNSKSKKVSSSSKKKE
tara:strand:+ start:270 stop:428 length:159 start_codon:yes stop_codon:yes gene_type:complete